MLEVNKIFFVGNLKIDLPEFIRLIQLISTFPFREFVGLIVRDFKGIPSIQEVECTGSSLQTEVNLLSLSLFSVPSNTVLGHVNLLTNKCVTFSDFASCIIDGSQTRKTVLRVLVYDLGEEETRQYGCNCTTVRSLGETERATWFIVVKAKSKSLYLCVE